MPDLKYSIVIPTRDRHQTLKYTLETCLAQEFENYEVVVSDNSSSDDTKQVVDSIASHRIVYRRTPRPLSMQDNWNAAYDLTRGDWVIFIGDDDGLMPFGLRQLDNAIARHKVKAVRWHGAVYTWPNIIEPSYANYLNFSLAREEAVLSSRLVIEDVLAGALPPGLLPNLYHGAVSRDIAETIKAKGGSVFAGFHPDTYSSFAVAYHVEHLLSLMFPISIAGFSKASNNISFTFLRRKNQVSDIQKKENHAADIGLHPCVPDIPTHSVVIYDSFLLAKRDLFPHDTSLVVDRKAFTERLLRELPIDDVAEWPAALVEIRRSLSDSPSLVTWFDAFAASVPPRTRPRDKLRPEVLGFDKDSCYLHIDTAKCGISTVADAARLADGILNYPRDMVPNLTTVPTSSKPGGLFSRLKTRRR